MQKRNDEISIIMHDKCHAIEDEHYQQIKYRDTHLSGYSQTQQN